jgi:hypothetical protein
MVSFFYFFSTSVTQYKSVSNQHCLNIFLSSFAYSRREKEREAFFLFYGDEIIYSVCLQLLKVSFVN